MPLKTKCNFPGCEKLLEPPAWPMLPGTLECLDHEPMVVDALMGDAAYRLDKIRDIAARLVGESRRAGPWLQIVERSTLAELVAALKKP